MTEPTRPKRGFALLSPERRAEMARAGGRAVPASKRAFSVDKGLAKAAGTKGGNENRIRHAAHRAHRDRDA